MWNKNSCSSFQKDRASCHDFCQFYRRCCYFIVALINFLFPFGEKTSSLFVGSGPLLLINIHLYSSGGYKRTFKQLYLKSNMSLNADIYLHYEICWLKEIWFVQLNTWAGLKKLLWQWNPTISIYRGNTLPSEDLNVNFGHSKFTRPKNLWISDQHDVSFLQLIWVPFCHSQCTWSCFELERTW